MPGSCSWTSQSLEARVQNVFHHKTSQSQVFCYSCAEWAETGSRRLGGGLDRGRLGLLSTLAGAFLGQQAP
jgi:hypothetical protein